MLHPFWASSQDLAPSCMYNDQEFAEHALCWPGSSLMTLLRPCAGLMQVRLVCDGG